MPQPNDRDREILKRRMESYDKREGPRVGDWVIYPDGKQQRLTYDWDDTIQTTTGDGECGSFHLGEDTMFGTRDAYVSYSGSLDRGIPKAKLKDTGRKQLGRIWFFHNDHACAHNGVDFETEFRVYEMTDD